MPVFEYEARKTPQTLHRGTIQADDLKQALNQISSMGLMPIDVTKASRNSRFDWKQFLTRTNVSRKERGLFTDQLSDLISSGLPLFESLTVLTNHTKSAVLSEAIRNITRRIKEGGSFSQALNEYPKIFDSFYVSMVHAGETSGMLDQALRQLAAFEERDEEFKSKISSASAYPALILMVGSASVIGLLTFVIPRLIRMFETLGQSLPLPTRMLIGLSDFLISYGWVLVTGCMALAFALHRFHKTPRGKITLDTLKLRIPVYGRLIEKRQIAHMTRTLSTLLKNGVDIVRALKVSENVVSNHAIKREVISLSESVVHGGKLSTSLSGSSYFPKYVSKIIAVGEESGHLDDALGRIAQNYDKEVDRVLKLLTSLLEPLLILVMGAIVGFMVVALLLPIFSINLIVG